MKKQEYFDMAISGGISIPQMETILQSILKISQTELFKLQDISSKYIYEAQQKIYKIKSWSPQEYILESAHFYGRDFFVDSRVLIPRNDTEILVSKVLKMIHLRANISDTIYIDVWVGSWCIPISIIAEMFPLRFFASYGFDVSAQAIEVATMNRDAFIPGKLEFRESNLLENAFSNEQLSWKKLCVTANLPYIKNWDFNNMDRSVIQHEPKIALYGWEKTGFELYEKLIKQCFQLQHIYKLKEIDIFIEIWFDQYEYSKAFLEELWLSFEYFLDNARIQRVIHIYGF